MNERLQFNPEAGENISQVEFFQITNKEDLEMAFDCGLVNLYQEVFAEPPYEEKFEEDEVRGFFDDYVGSGKLWLSLKESKVIGFSAGLPLGEENDIALIAEEFGFDSEDVWYFADLGVEKNNRRERIGTELTMNLIQSIPASTVIMRTAESNFASQELNKNLGFEIIEGMRQVVGGINPNGEPRSDNRIFLIYKK